MDMTIAYREVGTYRGAAAMCGCDPKTIKRALTRVAAGDERPGYRISATAMLAVEISADAMNAPFRSSHGRRSTNT